MRAAARDAVQGYQNAIDDQLEDAVASNDASHIAKLGGAGAQQLRQVYHQPDSGRSSSAA